MDTLPYELLMEIIKYLDLPSLFQLTSVAKVFNFDDHFYRYIFQFYPETKEYNFDPQRFPTYKSFLLYLCREEYFRERLKESNGTYYTLYHRLREQWSWEDIYMKIHSLPVLQSPDFEKLYSRISLRGREMMKFKPNEYNPDEIMYPVLDSQSTLNILTKDEETSQEIYNILMDLHYNFSMIRRLNYGHYIIEGNTSDKVWAENKTPRYSTITS